MTSFDAKDISENLSNRSWTNCSKSCLLLFLAISDQDILADLSGLLEFLCFFQNRDTIDFAS